MPPAGEMSGNVPVKALARAAGNAVHQPVQRHYVALPCVRFHQLFQFPQLLTHGAVLSDGLVDLGIDFGIDFDVRRDMDDFDDFGPGIPTIIQRLPAT